MTDTYIPMYDWVLILAKKDDEERITEGGIVLSAEVTGSISGSVKRGIVVSVGEGKLMEDGTISPPRLKEGDICQFNDAAAQEIVIGPNRFHIIREENILIIESRMADEKT